MCLADIFIAVRIINFVINNGKNIKIMAIFSKHHRLSLAKPLVWCGQRQIDWYSKMKPIDTIDEDGNKFTETQVIDQAIAFLFAGHDLVRSKKISDR
jgi:hypothetical protein